MSYLFRNSFHVHRDKIKANVKNYRNFVANKLPSFSNISTHSGWQSSDQEGPLGVDETKDTNSDSSQLHILCLHIRKYSKLQIMIVFSVLIPGQNFLFTGKGREI